ncbi:M28 family peptidase [Sphingobacterium sp. lm-10]|uniref:M28 family peptidase n=1 Tax=Sphingobacterium sp. lm-10 TaxID=2944904 RepID=UPI002020EB4F|nr:M28 family peptidase [Sphingobacterium sp. lm-10]MCL7989007.1 M28 family peptidase [Sphingobacterium sp. lm-10]
MKKYLSLLFIVPAVWSCTFAQDAAQKKYAGEITEELAKKHLTILASPEFEGRGTGQAGGQKATEYVAQQFKEFGLIKPVNGSYFQPVSLVKSVYAVKNFSIAGKSYTYGKDFYVQGENSLQNYSADELIFIGYGIADEKYNDLNGLDIAGKVVVFINEGEPKDASGNSLITGTNKESDWTRSRLKRLQELMKKNPKLIIATSSQVAQNLTRIGGRLTSGRVSLKKADSPAVNNGIPMVIATEDMINSLLASNKTDLDQVKKKISDTKKPNSFVIKAKLRADMGNSQEDLDDPNVLGLLEGSDLKDEIVVIGGHWDHDGILPDGTIFPGADDNGTGTVAVIDIARAFSIAKKEGKGPRRSILFIAYAAEEKGLLGSNYYVENPIFPLENTVACINIDMIGRIDDKHLEGNHNYVHVIGTNKLSSELNPLVEKANEQYTGMELDGMYNDPNDPMRLYYRSDHYNFAKKGIPSLFFFSGLHPHYHTPEDTVDKIDFPMMVKREHLIFHTTWDIVNRDNKLVVDIPEDGGVR